MRDQVINFTMPNYDSPDYPYNIEIRKAAGNNNSVVIRSLALSKPVYLDLETIKLILASAELILNKKE
jgi:hypothetical protein